MIRRKVVAAAGLAAVIATCAPVTPWSQPTCLAASPPEYTPLPGFKVPLEFWTDQDFHPIGYLKAYPVPDPDVTLVSKERTALADLFRAAAYACRFKYRQGYPLSTATPLYRVLRREYPGLAAVEGEGGHIVMTDAVLKVLEGPAGSAR